MLDFFIEEIVLGIFYFGLGRLIYGDEFSLDRSGDIPLHRRLVVGGILLVVFVAVVMGVFTLLS